MLNKKLWSIVSIFMNLIVIISLAMTIIGCSSKKIEIRPSVPEKRRIDEIASLRIIYPKMISWKDIQASDVLRLNVGNIRVLVEYDAYATLGVKNASSVMVYEGVIDKLFVDKSTVIIEVLDAYVTNYRHIISYSENPIMQVDRYVTPDLIFELQKEHEIELKRMIMESSENNIAIAMENFKLNFENMVLKMGFKDVIWAENADEYNRLIQEANFAAKNLGSS